ncbi:MULTISPECIES: metal-dependent hydrolase [unclassified Micromonospora]|uniref:metal-dependent hydrolase n=1 Tax=unclassified Micromonospora TaxID=2617518 RepID=UPI00103504E0|nr:MULTISPECIES: metal-dependent hydrolase [unclassified Micromonospora]QKW15164.1 metal-dependent hydrolase [Verrucosispora sp. NA02020]TBL36252.1 metal-dependent hydrolase [Verrucosispora sp. SN26_14.1]
MMGPSHALSGAAVWLSGSWALQHFYDYEQSPLALAVGTAVCAGAALLPDIDLSGKVTRNRGGATVARTFGVFSLFVAEVVEKISLGVYYATKLSRDPKRNNGHRTLTHTIPFTVLVGWGTTTLCVQYGKWAVIGILFFMIGLALRGLFDKWAARAGWVIVTLVSAGAAVFTAVNLPGDRGYPMIGLAVGVGSFVHILGDMITRAGVPILWPIPIKRRMWTPISLPDKIAMRAGGRTETVFVRTGLMVVSTLAALGLVAPSVLEKFHLDI